MCCSVIGKVRDSVSLIFVSHKGTYDMANVSHMAKHKLPTSLTLGLSVPLDFMIPPP